MSDLIDRQAAIDAIGEEPKVRIGLLKSYKEGRNDQWFDDVSAINRLPSAEPDRNTGRWNRLMMYLADLQLTYSPNWGANGCGDEKLYEFVTGLIEELEGWTDGGGA